MHHFWYHSVIFASRNKFDMIIISSRKFRDSQSEYFRKALTEDVILTTVHYGCFKLVPIVEGEPRKEEMVVMPASESKKVRIQEEPQIVDPTTSVGTEIVAESKPVEVIDEFKTQVEKTEVSQARDINESTLSVQEYGSNTNENQIIRTQIEKPVVQEKKTSNANVYVDPALYDAFPEEYAAELEAERKMIEELKYTGLRKFFHKIGKK